MNAAIFSGGIIIFFLFTSISQAQVDVNQRIQQQDLETIKKIDPNTYSSIQNFYPITRDTLGIYPDSLYVEGKRVDFALGVSCGYFCGCGSIKLALKNQPKDYTPPFVFLAIPCMKDKPKKTYKGWIYKIPLEDTSCFWTEFPVNIFDSGKIPFYTIYNAYNHELLEKSELNKTFSF